MIKRRNSTFPIILEASLLEKIVLIGAGSAMFTRGVVRDLMATGMPAVLALVDIDPQALEIARRLCEKMIAAKEAPIQLQATLDRRQVLPGATVVITTIGVGKRRAWEQDVFIPRKYGIYMPVGDTVGPGGTSRALRMVPAMVAIARDVLELCPEALFFNYANPMAIICRAIRKATGAPVVGLCHGTHDTAAYLAGHLGVARSELVYTAVGINHMTWFTDVRIGAQDAMPRLRAIADGILERTAQALAAHQKGKPMPDDGGAFSSSLDYPFSWQCLKWFGAFPAPLDRHVCEFFPQFFRDGSYYGKTLGVDEFSFEGTIAAGDHIYEDMQQDAFSNSPLDASYFEKLGGEHEQVLEIIQSIRANQKKVYSANLPNTGQVANLPLGAVIEAPAVSDARGLHPLQLPPLSTAIAGTLATRFQWVEATVEAALEGSRDKFIQALILDGAVSSPDMAGALADDLLEAQKAYLDW
jgi:alpha-galactosidase